MSYYRTCPHCGANLDPGEVCDCRDKERAAQGAANTEDGKVEHVDHAVSTSDDTTVGGGFQVWFAR